MSINGVLEDLPIADVLQFIHLGQRSGTLYMWRDDDLRAEIGFLDGRIVRAWTPDHQRLGDLLVERSLIDQDTLQEALRIQRGQASGQSIGQILLAGGAVERDEVHRVIKEQIQRTIFDLVTWKHGRFAFEVDELHPVDDFAIGPEELFLDRDLNTQMLLLEATRIFDERVAEGLGEESDQLTEQLRRAGLGTGREAPGEPSGEPGEGARGVAGLAPVAVRCQLVTAEDELATEVTKALPGELANVVRVKLREAGNRVPGELASPIVVLDFRQPELRPEDVATLSRTRPSAPVVAVVESPAESAEELLEAGAVAVVEARAGAVAGACRNLIRVLSHPQPHGTFGYAGSGGFSRFRRVVYDVQSGLISATMALNLMHVISESVERAVLFLVQGDRLVAVGAFGFSHDGRPLADVTRGMHLEPPLGGALEQALSEAEPVNVQYGEAELPQALAGLVGRPRTGQVVIFPVLGAQRPISVIYTDNGAVDREIEDIKILELATSQVGVAFENELLGQRLAGRGFDTVLE